MQCCNKNILRKIRIYMNPVMHKSWNILKLFKFLYVYDIVDLALNGRPSYHNTKWYFKII